MLQLWGLGSKKKNKERRMSVGMVATVKNKAVSVRNKCDEKDMWEKIACLERNLSRLKNKKGVDKKKEKLEVEIKAVYKGIENTREGFFYYLYQHTNKEKVGLLRDKNSGPRQLFSYYENGSKINTNNGMTLWVNITQDEKKNYTIEFCIAKGAKGYSDDFYYQRLLDNEKVLQHAWMAKMTVEKEEKEYKYTVAYAFDDKHHLCYRCTKGTGTRSFHLTDDGKDGYFICGDEKLKIIKYQKSDENRFRYKLLDSWTITVKGDVPCLWVRLKF